VKQVLPNKMIEGVKSMPRKTMSREVTKTTAKVAVLEMEDGQPVAAELPDEIFVGKISLEQAQRLLNKKYGKPVTVFGVETDTKTYEMAVEDFIAFATVKEENEVSSEN
jgi:hypothetical protein